jgi:hypothetical protein
MKQLALASVAFGAVVAFGAGDAFAQPWVAVQSESTGVYATGANAAIFNNSLNWNSAGPATYGATSASVTVNSLNGLFNAKVSVTNSTFIGATTIGAGVAAVPAGAAVLGATGRGTIGSSSGFGFEMLFSKNIKVYGVGLDLSPVFGCDAGSNFGVPVGQSGCTSGPTKYVVTLAAYSSTVPSSEDLVFSSSFVVSLAQTTFVGIATTMASVKNHTAIPFMAITGSITATTGTVNVNYFGDVLGPVSIEGVPEPASLSVLGVGLLGLGALRQRRAAGSKNGARWSPFGRWRVAEDPPDPSSS